MAALPLQARSMIMSELSSCRNTAFKADSFHPLSAARFLDSGAYSWVIVLNIFFDYIYIIFYSFVLL